MCSTENSSESLNHDTREVFLFLPQLVFGFKKTRCIHFPIFCIKVLSFECHMENPRGDASCVVLLVPPVLPSEDLAERVFLH